MKAVLLVVAFAAVVLGRPDIGLTLRGKQLTTSYGVPSASITNFPSGSYIPVSPTYQPPIISTPIPFYTGSSTPLSILSENSQISNFPNVYTQHISNGFIGDSSYQGLNSQLSSQHQAIYNTQQSSHQSQYSSSSSHEAEVRKHVYFYEAPEELEQPKPHVSIPFAAPKKNVKILFIKAPHYAHPTYPTIPVQPQNEEKTIVYVLVKKPEEQADIHVVTPPPTQPSKPEVYFIKYKNQKEAEDKVSTTLNEHSSSGANVISNVDENSYVGNGASQSQEVSSLEGTGDVNTVVVSSTENSIDTGSIIQNIPSYESGSFSGSLASGGSSYEGGSSFGSDFASNGNNYASNDNNYASNGYNYPSGVSVLGNGLSGHYVSSTEPSIVDHTGYANTFGIVSSTVAPISIGNVQSTYGPPGESGPY